MIPADADEEVLTSEEIAQKYKVNMPQVGYWSEMEGFPKGWPAGPGRTLVRDACEVDEWLRENLPVHWARGQESDNPYGLPEGNPKDLLSLKDIGVCEAQALGRDEPVPTATLRGYLSKRTMPQPDRTPGDGLKPEVTERMWFRETVYDWVNRPRTMRRQTKAGRRSDEASASTPSRPRKQASSRAQESSRVDVDGIAAKYRVSRPTAGRWTHAEGFPSTDKADYDAAAVDAWVRSERRRTWEAAPKRSVTAAEQKEPTSAEAGGRSRRKSGVELTADQIGPRYGVPADTGLNWIKVKAKVKDGKVVRRSFPAPLRTAPRVWEKNEVDDWVKEARPHVWAAFKGTGPVLLNPLPEGDPRDLLDVDDFAEVWGNATRGEPLARQTIFAYHNRGQIPYADRVPDDGKTPRVLSYHWYRETVYDFITSRPGSGNYEPKRPRE
ncbi:hypothetical protein [Streptomyces sp. MZ04]|uniref:hypothetical protein n=1 Tax=Streptomyces sp. MZ04 TaxID=2559236 RepID=UPI00107ED07B|nr:hypothetical protein [Streptomyces sp. MZ04]TGB15485.1 hypothetical protein E2651_02325 [Streptomyces sp. MZ04]